jgi:DNA-binding transcriptional LysR family regulator
LDLAQLNAFVAVVRSGSFTTAAELLATDKAHVSRLVSRLETALGAQLLTRSTRALAVTEFGREVYEWSAAILDEIEQTEAIVAQARGEPTGTLKLTCGEEFGLLAVSRWIIAYQHRYPAMRVEADLTNRVADLIHDGFDVAIRVGVLPDSSLAARKLGEIDYALYGSPSYLEAKGEPQEPGELASHDVLKLTSASAQSVQPLRLIQGKEAVSVAVAPRLAVNSNALLRQACVAGIGIALLPTFQAATHVEGGALVEVLPGWSRAPVPVHAVFPSSRFLAPKVRCFVDVARQEFASSLSCPLMDQSR